MTDDESLRHFRRLWANVRREQNRILLGPSILEAHRERLRRFVARVELRKIIQLPTREATKATGLTTHQVRIMRARLKRVG